jgi:hypothetical protein
MASRPAEINLLNANLCTYSAAKKLIKERVNAK